MTPSPDEVRRLAALARLRLTDEEILRMASELGSILGHVEVLRRAGDGWQAAPPWGDDDAAKTPLRPDLVGADPLHVSPESFAPAWEQDFFVAPRLPALDPDADREPGR